MGGTFSSLEIFIACLYFPKKYQWLFYFFIVIQCISSYKKTDIKPNVFENHLANKEKGFQKNKIPILFFDLTLFAPISLIVTYVH
jgi:hypothetical protein